MPAAQFTRRQITKIQDEGGDVGVKPAVTGCGVDPASGDVWLALGNLLVIVNKDGDHTAEYRSYTPKERASSRAPSLSNPIASSSSPILSEFSNSRAPIGHKRQRSPRSLTNIFRAIV